MKSAGQALPTLHPCLKPQQLVERQGQFSLNVMLFALGCFWEGVLYEMCNDELCYKGDCRNIVSFPRTLEKACVEIQGSVSAAQWGL